MPLLSCSSLPTASSSWERGGTGQAEDLPLPNFGRDPYKAGLATPSSPGSCRLPGWSLQGPQPNKQTLLEPELMVKKPGGQCPAPRDGGRDRPGRGRPAAPRSCMLGVGVGGREEEGEEYVWSYRGPAPPVFVLGAHLCLGKARCVCADMRL